MTEKWIPVVDYEHFYKVSNLGRVKNSQGKILKPIPHPCGYLTVNLYKNRNPVKFLIHRLVAKSFLGDKQSVEASEVNHKDGCKTNNNLNNLEWVTSSENNKHAIRIGLRAPLHLIGEAHGRARLRECDVREIKKLTSSMSHRKIAKHFDVSKSCITDIINGKNWSHVI